MMPSSSLDSTAFSLNHGSACSKWARKTRCVVPAADDNGGGGDAESEKSASECNCWRGVVGGVRAGEVGGGEVAGGVRAGDVGVGEMTGDLIGEGG